LPETDDKKYKVLMPGGKFAN